MDETKEWKTVVGKKQKYVRRPRMDIARRAQHEDKHQETTFFFTRFLEDHGAKEMLRIFSLYGKAIEVVIPPKRDKSGRIFGFVRFQQVKEVERFAVKLDNIIIGATKIHVNTSRFQREYPNAWQVQNIRMNGRTNGRSEAREGDEDRKGKKVIVCDNTMNKNERYREGNSKAVTDKVGWARSQWGDKYKMEAQRGLLCYEVGDEEMRRFSKMFIGYVSQPGTSYRIQDWFSMQGVFSIKVTPLGANSVLLEDLEEGVLEELVNESNGWIYEWFDDIRRWNPNTVDQERLVWVRCHGIPPHAWGEGICDLLAKVPGRMGII